MFTPYILPSPPPLCPSPGEGFEGVREGSMNKKRKNLIEVNTLVSHSSRVRAIFNSLLPTPERTTPYSLIPKKITQ